MPSYTYIAYNKSKDKETGQITATSEKEANRILHEKNLTVINIKIKKSSPKLNLNLSKSVPAKEKIIFTRQLAIMIKAGMPVVQAISALIEQSENQNLKIALEKVNQDVKGGTPLSVALNKFPHIFPSVYISVIASGEKSGKLEEVLNNLADQQEKDYDIITKVKSAMIYPIIILIALFGVMFLIMFFIMPQLSSVFKDFGGELPPTTQFLMSFSESLRKYVLFYTIGLILMFLGIKQWIKVPSGRHLYDTIKIKFPIIGMLNKKIYMARFTRTMSMLISSGLPMLEVIKTSGEVINNSIYKKSLDTLFKSIESGIPLSEVLKNDPNFPSMIGHMTTIGEQSGKLDYVLSQIASFYEKEVENTTRNLSTMIEPVLMVLMGIGVAFVVISVLGPISSITNNM